jgi:radical SAM superfamily enzyme YgiQ (UPF0313 family)
MLDNLLTIIEPSSVSVAPVNRHVTVIRPAMLSSTGTWSNPVTPPLGLAYLCATLESAGHRVHAVDGIGERVDQFIEEEGYLFQGLTIQETVERIPAETDLIGVSCMFSQDWPFCRELIRAIRMRFPSTPIVAGGEHITALPEYSLRDCDELDICVLGEGEETIVELANHVGHWDHLLEVNGIAYIEAGQFKQTAPRQRIQEVDDVPLPAWDYFPMEEYLGSRNAHGVYLGRSMGILATRGCPYKCTFCSNPVMYGKLWIHRSPEKVVDEIEHYVKKYQATNIDFYDLTMIIKKSWILEFCRLLEARGLKITWQLPTGTRSEVIDDEVSAALYRTGCRNVTYAPESGSVETLKLIKKQVDLDKLTTSARAAIRNNIHVKVNLIIGFPHETRKHVLATVWFAWKLAWLGVHDAAIFLFSPYPGSKLFDELREESKIGELNEDYFRSLVAFMDPFAPSEYCRHVRGRELAFWRLFGMASFFGLSYLFRPIRFIRLIKNVIKNESETVLEQRLGALVHRPKALHATKGRVLQPAHA